MALSKKFLNINGVDRMFICDPEKDTLATALRRLGLTGTKVGCGVGQCGSCSIILDGKVVRSCARKIKNIPEYAKVETIEGIGTATNLHPLQQAFITYGGVQCGFCSPGFIMSALGLLRENVNPTREEVRDWFQKHRNLCRCTGYKPIVDAVMAAAKVMRGEASMKDITFDMEKTKNGIYGTALPRPSALAKVTGLCDYGDDIKYKMPEGTLHLAVVQPKVSSHAKILSIDTAPAEAVPGVYKVVTAKDVQGTNRMLAPIFNPRSLLKGNEFPIIADQKICRYGDVVAVVIADSEEIAREAAKKVIVEIESLPEYMNLLDAVVPDAIPIHGQTPNMFMVGAHIKGEDASEVIDNSFCSVEGSFYSPREAHLSIEGNTMQGYWDEQGNMTIHCKTMAIGWARHELPAGVGIPIEKLRLIENPTGGSFGWACSGLNYALMAVCLMVVKDRPLTLTMSYEEHQHFSGKRAPGYTNGRLACDEAGKLTAMEYDIALDRGAFADEVTAEQYKAMSSMGMQYVIPNIAGIGRCAVTNHTFGTAYRGFGAVQAYTASEAMMDMLAEKMRMDPFEFRYINLPREGQTNNTGHPFRDYVMPNIMDKLRPYYQKALAEAKAASTPEVKRGVGVVTSMFGVAMANMDMAEIHLELNPDGTVTHFNTWEDQGQGGDIGTLTVTHEALKPLGLSVDQIRLHMNDSHLCPDSGVAAASRSHFMTGNAVIDAAEKLIRAMRKDDGTFRTYDEMVAEGIPTKYAGKSSTSFAGPSVNPNTLDGNPFASLMYGAFIAEVAVEVSTGKATCLGMTGVADVGRIGNILSVEGQAYGGLSHGISFALQTQYEDVKKHATMAGAGIPYIKDIPDNINIMFMDDNPRACGPFGSTGASEVFQCSQHMAVINAINNAVGVRIYELPASPEKVKAALEAKAKGQELKPKKYFLGSDFYDQLDYLKANPF